MPARFFHLWNEICTFVSIKLEYVVQRYRSCLCMLSLPNVESSLFVFEFEEYLLRMNCLLDLITLLSFCWDISCICSSKTAPANLFD